MPVFEALAQNREFQTQPICWPSTASVASRFLFASIGCPKQAPHRLGDDCCAAATVDLHRHELQIMIIV
jgi:hypothetical protein